MGAIRQFIDHDTGYKSTYEYDQIMSHMTALGADQDEEEARSLALRLMIHYTGDIHQPLHSTSRVDKEYP
jgi:hypothetical protein